MKGFTVTIAVDVPPRMAFTEQFFPNLAYAVERVTEVGQQIWQGYAQGAPLPGGQTIKSRSGAYLRSIQIRHVGLFAGQIFSDLPYARLIEEGWPARDMKRMLDSSVKVRVNKKGKRYLIIPFRHGAPSSTTLGTPMPTAVHQLWTQGGLGPSRVTGMKTRVSGTGAYDPRTHRKLHVPQRKYRWGDSLSKAQLNAAGVFGVHARRMQGMVRMQNATGRGGGKHTQYLTFRVMTEDSTGWILKPKAGFWPARATSQKLAPLAEKAFAAALEADIQAFLA